MMTFTEEQVQAYLKSDGQECPFCSSDQITSFTSPEVQGAKVYQDVECDDCGASWTDEYALSGLTFVLGPDEARLYILNIS